MLRSSRHINMLSLSHSLEMWKNRDEKSDKLKNYKSLRTLECYHSGLKAMDPNATWCIHPWSPCFLHTQLPYSLQAAGSACLAPSCCGAKPLHVLQHTSPSILPTCRNLHVCARAVLLSVCTVQMDADWLLLFNSGWICFYGWACPGGTVVSCLWGRQAPGSLRAAAASQPSGTETEECRLYFQ